LLIERGVSPQSFLRAGESGQGADSLSEPQERSSTGRRLAIRGLASFLR
jgi:hypothetical protein